MNKSCTSSCLSNSNVQDSMVKDRWQATANLLKPIRNIVTNVETI